MYKDKKIELNNIIEKLKLVNPLNILDRGYTLTYINDSVITSSKKIKKGNIIKTKFNDGYVISKVEEVNK